MTDTRYKVDASISILVEKVSVRLDDEMIGTIEEELSDALTKILKEQLTLLDIRGSRSGDDGYVTQISVEQIDNWSEI